MARPDWEALWASPERWFRRLPLVADVLAGRAASEGGPYDPLEPSGGRRGGPPRPPGLLPPLPVRGERAGVRGSGGGSWLEQAVWRAAARLDAAFVGGTAAGRAVAARRLAGLGEGLTPAGDDYLLGAFHALWALDHPLRREAPALAELAAARTTSHSAAWLRAAAGGSVSPPWARLLLALAAASDAAVAPSAAAVAATGHSSGRWSLRGFCVLARCLAAAPPIALEAR